MSTFNAKIGLLDNASEGSVEVLESLPLGVMHLEPEMVDVEAGNFHGEPRSIRLLPSWMEYHSQPQQSIGDAFGMQGEHILTLNQPYVGDERYDKQWCCVSS